LTSSPFIESVDAYVLRDGKLKARIKDRVISS